MSGSTPDARPMRVLFLLIWFRGPRGEPNLYGDLVEEFVRQGHDVHVATILEAREGRETYEDVIDGARVLHVRCGNLFGVNPITKGLTTLRLPRRFGTALSRFWGEATFDLVIYPTPPITFAPVVRDLKRRQGCRSYLILRDIFPQNAKDLGMIRDPLTYRYFRRQEQRLYELSDHIGCMSHGNIDYVRRHNAVDPAKLHVLYNWERVTAPVAPAARAEVRRRYDLEGKFVAVFGGNIGFAQGLEFLLELAALYRDRSDIVFLIVGTGAVKDRVARLVQERRLDNVRMMDFIPRSDFQALLGASDVGLINLDRRFTIPNIPSKTLGYFAAAVPVLAAIDASTDYGALLDECDAGLWSVTGDLPAYRANFERLLGDAGLRRRLGANGRRAFLERFTVSSAYDTIMDRVGHGRREEASAGVTASQERGR